MGGEEELKIIKIKDNIKTQFCVDKNIDLLRIPYTQIKYIEKILKEKLNIK